MLSLAKASEQPRGTWHSSFDRLLPATAMVCTIELVTPNVAGLPAQLRWYQALPSADLHAGPAVFQAVN